MKRIFHTIALIAHNFFAEHKFTTKDLSTIATLGSIYAEVKRDTKGITDPAELTKAVCTSVIRHEDELPEEIKASGLEHEIITIMHNVTSLPLAEIEALVKKELAALHK